MIATDKDRFECLKLAVSIFIPRQGITLPQIADEIVKTADKFHKFVSGGPADHEQDASDLRK